MPLFSIAWTGSLNMVLTEKQNLLASSWMATFNLLLWEVPPKFCFLDLDFIQKVKHAYWFH